MSLEFSRDQASRIARTLFGEPNSKLSSRDELRFGAHGSKSVDLRKAVWFDHESNEGGDLFGRVKSENSFSDRETFEWLEREGFKPREPAPTRSNGANEIQYDEANDPFSGVKFKNNSKQFHIVATWPYVNEAGAELFQVCRRENGEIGADGKPFKDYRQRHKGPDGYIDSVKGIRQVPYRLPKLIEAIAQDKLVFIVEGEKCVDAVIALGGDMQRHGCREVA